MNALTAALLALAWGFYAAGLGRLWRRAGRGRGVGFTEAALFYSGWAIVAAAVLEPLHHAAERLLWAYMVQHELLMVLAA